MTFGSLSADCVLLVMGLVASHRVAEYFPRWLKLPLITGYLFVGILAGPYISNMWTQEMLSRLAQTINSLALSFISFQAGFEIYYPTLRPQLKDILATLGGIYVASMVLMTSTLYLFSDYFFFSDLPPLCRLSICLLFSSIGVLNSPGTALALHVEYGTEGPFTNMMLGVTSMAELVVLLSFSVARILCTTHCQDIHLSVPSIVFSVSVAVSNLLVGILFGLIIWCVIAPPLSRKNKLLRTVGLGVKGALWMGMGFAFFTWTRYWGEFSYDTWGAQWTVHLEPLLVCMVASSFVGHCRNTRDKMHEILEPAAAFVYLPFFTMTGASLSVPSLLQSLPLMSAYVTVRFLAKFLGTYVTCRFILKLPREMYMYLWLCFTPQAGVALGLSQEILQSSSDSWTSDFNVTIVSAVVVNQILGPLLSTIGIRKSGEARPELLSAAQRRTSAAVGGGRDEDDDRDRLLRKKVTIIGRRCQTSMMLASEFSAIGVHVRLAPTEAFLTTPDRLPTATNDDGAQQEGPQEGEEEGDVRHRPPPPAGFIDVEDGCLATSNSSSHHHHHHQEGGVSTTHHTPTPTMMMTEDTIVVVALEDSSLTREYTENLVQRILTLYHHRQQQEEEAGRTTTPVRCIALVKDQESAAQLAALGGSGGGGGVLVVSEEVALSHVIVNLALASDSDAVYLSQLAHIPTARRRAEPKATTTISLLEQQQQQEEATADDDRSAPSFEHSSNFVSYHAGGISSVIMRRMRMRRKSTIRE